MAQSEDAGERIDKHEQEGLLRAQLAIEPHPESNCAVVNEGKDAQEVTHQLKVNPSESTDRVDVSECGECHASLTFDGEENEERTYLKSAVSTKCICPIFKTHDCIPRIRSIESGSIIVTLTAPMRGTLREIIGDLRRVGASVSIEWLVYGADSDQTAEIDVSTVTEKQRETLEHAVESGYYETPRKTDLSEISSEFGISESATSQRLNAAETKLVKAFLEQ